MDAVSIDTVIAAEADCSDRVRAEAALSRALGATRGPKRSKEAAGGSGDKHWRLEMSIVTSSPGIKSADAKIQDDTGHVVAERTVSDKTTGTCIALARAVGAWAQIVLDDELVRAHEEADKAKGPDPEPVESRPIKMTTSRPPRATTEPDADDITPKEDKDQTVRTFEIGTTLFLRNGVASSGGIFGASPFVTIGFSKTWVIRPAALIGTSTSRVPPDQSNSANLVSFGGRVDFCRRMPGNYLDRRGIEIDACAGGDVMHVSSDLASAWRASLGPSGILRGELGDFGLELRAMAGANLMRGGLGGADAPFFVAGAEVGGSVRFR